MERQQQQPRPGPEHELLGVVIGKWINEGYTVTTADAPSVKILTNDVYEWMPGGFFVLHTAYGGVGSTDVGGTEIIGYDEENKKHLSFIFYSLKVVEDEQGAAAHRALRQCFAEVSQRVKPWLVPSFWFRETGKLLCYLAGR